jgi:hypothetical protein
LQWNKEEEFKLDKEVIVKKKQLMNLKKPMSKLKMEGFNRTRLLSMLNPSMLRISVKNPDQ